MSHVATEERVVAPLVGARQHERNRFFIKNSQTQHQCINPGKNRTPT